jgi:hypothetical protein
MPFELKLRRNLDYHEGAREPKYFFVFELELGEVIGRPVSSRLPVFWRPNDIPHPILKEFYWVDIAGVRVEKGNLAALEKAVPHAVLGLLDFGTIPYYYISIPGGDRLPVFLKEGKLRLREPSLEGQDIGQLWHRLGDHLLQQKKIQAKEEVEVSLLLWKELKVYSTAFVLVDGRAFIPLFWHGKEELNYDIIGQPPRFLPLEEAFALRREVARDLVAKNQLSSTYELRMEQVPDGVWERLREGARPTDRVLSYEEKGERKELPVYEMEGEVFAARRMSRLGLLFAANIDELAQRVSADLARRGHIASTSRLSVERSKK